MYGKWMDGSVGWNIQGNPNSDTFTERRGRIKKCAPYAWAGTRMKYDTTIQNKQFKFDPNEKQSKDETLQIQHDYLVFFLHYLDVGRWMLDVECVLFRFQFHIKFCIWIILQTFQNTLLFGFRCSMGSPNNNIFDTGP